MRRRRRSTEVGIDYYDCICVLWSAITVITPEQLHRIAAAGLQAFSSLRLVRL